MHQILFISQVDLFTDNGGAYSNRAQLDCFIALGYKITLLYPETKTAIPAEYNDISIIRVPERSKIDKFIGIFKGYIHRFSPYVEKWYIKNDHPHYDFVYISGGIVSGDLAPFFTEYGLKVITLHNNVEIEYYLSAKNILTIWGKYAGFIKRKERNALIYSTLNLTVTNHDLERLKMLYHLPNNLQIVNWGCFEYKSKPLPRTFHRAHQKVSIAITGTLSDPQTYNSIIAIKEILIDLVTHNSDFTIIIAGRKPPKMLYQAFKGLSRIQIIDSPKDMESILGQCHIFLNPVQYGSGLKLRNMDALRLGLPCIVHRISSHGYEQLEAGHALQIYDNNNELVDYLHQTIASGLCQTDRVQSLYSSVFSFDVGVRTLQDILMKHHLLN